MRLHLKKSVLSDIQNWPNIAIWNPTSPFTWKTQLDPPSLAERGESKFSPPLDQAYHPPETKRLRMWDQIFFWHTYLLDWDILQSFELETMSDWVLRVPVSLDKVATVLFYSNASHTVCLSASHHLSFFSKLPNGGEAKQSPLQFWQLLNWSCFLKKSNGGNRMDRFLRLLRW